jgi:hypothetical protein
VDCTGAYLFDLFEELIFHSSFLRFNLGQIFAGFPALNFGSIRGFSFPSPLPSSALSLPPNQVQPSHCTIVPDYPALSPISKSVNSFYYGVNVANTNFSVLVTIIRHSATEQLNNTLPSSRQLLHSPTIIDKLCMLT